MSENLEQRILWIQLALSKGVGPTTFWKLLKQSPDIYSALRCVDEPCSLKTVENILSTHTKNRFRLICACDADFPQKLRILNDCPPIISTTGSLDVFKKRSLAIVGARNASLVGKVLAKKIASALGKQGFVVISGLARGIDTAAHEGSLDSGTLAVMSGGIDVVYPPENIPLYDNIIKQDGLVLSEMMPGTHIEAGLFPRRNRLIAALSDGVVVIEAAEQSGSLITANFALEQGKDIFVVPSSPVDPRSRGGNRLIKQGAFLIDSAEDILQVVNSGYLNRQQSLFQDSEKQDLISKPCDEVSSETSIKDMILSELSFTPISIEVLFQTQSFCSLPHLLSLIGELEIEGKIQRHANSQISLVG